MRIFLKLNGFGEVRTGTEWVIDHNKGYYPIVRVYTTTGDGNDFWERKDEIIPYKVIHNSVNQVTIVFLESQTGTVSLF